jgi:predicted HNH restriction endonuclease
MCGITEEEHGRQLDVHHKVPFRLFDSPIEANRLSNLISVCPSCHKKLEDSGRADMPLFEDVKHPRQRSK